MQCHPGFRTHASCDHRVRQVVAAHGPDITDAALSDMPYTDACAKEALRIK